MQGGKKVRCWCVQKIKGGRKQSAVFGPGEERKGEKKSAVVVGFVEKKGGRKKVKCWDLVER